MNPNQIVSDFNSYFRKHGGSYSAWYVGIASKPRERLFNDHNVDEKNDAWIFRDAENDTMARKIEKHFHDLGCKGDGGGGDYTTRYVYAYKINSHTVE